MQQELMSVQTEVRSVANDLEKTHRTDPGYIELVKKEHEILLVEKEMTNKIKNLDKAERDHFSLLSTFVRESHEKERARAERTKYWSVIGSVIGALVGIIGSTWNNRMRLKEMRAIVTETGEAAADYKEVATKLISNLSVLNPDDSSTLLNKNENNNSFDVSPNGLQESIDKQTDVITRSIHEQMELLLSNFDDVKKILSVTNSNESFVRDNDNVVYVGPDIKLMLEETRRDLRKDSLKNMISVSVLGCLFTVSLSIIVASFTKSS